MLQVFLFLHVLGAIAVFGPTFIFPLLASRAAKEPQHAHFTAEIAEFIESRIVIPGAVVQGITGVILIVIVNSQGTDLRVFGWPWLPLGIVLYIVAIGYAIAVQAPAATRIVQLTGAMSWPPPAGAPAGPPPEIAATAKKLQQGGMLLTVLIVLIVLLMVVKPTIG
jgi:Predicted integral membrane protein (DUF2269)